MKPIQLAPVAHRTPTCDAYDDLAAVRRFETEIRVHRAFAEPFYVVPAGDRVDGAYKVTGGSGAGYDVDIVDGSGEADACTCPDFLTGELGTCKHLEAVRRAIAASARMRRALAAVGTKPACPTLTVSATRTLELRAVGRFAPGALASLGLTSVGDDLQEVQLTQSARPVELRAGLHASGVRVVHAVLPALERLRAERARAMRREELSLAFAADKIGVEVLAKPLMPYQKDGVVHLAAAGRALLADDMGLGKTVQAIAACEILRRRGEARRILIVTPASLKDQWSREIAQYAGERAVVVSGGASSRGEALASDAAYTILNYEVTWRELSRLQALGADVVVLDEAQRAKNFRTKTAKTLRELRSPFLFVLTGTPVENRLDDLYALVQLVDPAVFGPLWKYNFDFCTQNETGKIIGYANLSKLRERIAPVLLRRRREDVLTQLPALTEQTRYTRLTPEQADLESGYRADATKYMSLAERRPLTPQEQQKLMTLLLKARQACNAVELCRKESKPASPKLDELEALISEITSQGASKILIFSEWVEMLKLAAKRLDALGVGHVMLHGGIPTEKRPALIDGFRNDDRTRVLLSSDAGGVGLNLQVASYVVHLDLPWNPARLDQRTARAHRLGQTRGVSVTYLCAEGGIERGIEGTLQAKRAVRSAALDVESAVETLDTKSFSVFLRELRDACAAAEVQSDLRGAPRAAEGPEKARRELLITGETMPDVLVPDVPAERPAPPRPFGAHAHDRLRLARVVLRAGFHGDAIGAAYDALAAAVSKLLAAPPPPSPPAERRGLGHALLVAAIYRELLPAARLPAAAHAALARLHDLAGLAEHGVEVDAELAEAAVSEAEGWIARLLPAEKRAQRAPARVREGERAPLGYDEVGAVESGSLATDRTLD